MAPVRPFAPVLRLIGYAAFLVWVVLVAGMVSVASLAGLGRFASRTAGPAA